ncbi:phage tail protein I [Aliarcobacter butzleri]|uniref:phage tail protein I n=1 Tax=Aliarcobacter butzleri TaxID=28197 RepID=UPI001EDED618|nr:phage tail protein I [Aliarcobacter butzleri]MCG3696915.1 phage tail protein I [Aliarcobacter butzleri]MDN5091002.1 phage tail protein I [Aliarcobacter butzleri]
MSLISLLPTNEDEKLKAIDLVYETRVAKLKEELQVISTLAHPKLADEKYLPYLAHSHQVDFWSNELTLDEKRAIIDHSILLHRKKGTLLAVKEVLKRLNIDVKFYEWFEYAGLPYHFKIDVDFLNRPVEDKDLKIIEEFVEIYKNTKSILELININIKTNLKEKYAMATITGEEIEVLPYTVRNLNFYQKEIYATAVKISECITLNLVIGDL